MIRRPPRSTLFPTRRSSDLGSHHGSFGGRQEHAALHPRRAGTAEDRKSTRLNSSHVAISYAVFCLKKKKKNSQYMTQKKQNIQNIIYHRHRNKAIINYTGSI